MRGNSTASGPEVQPALRSVGDELKATLVRLFAYVGALAVLAVVAAHFFQAEEPAIASEPAPRAEWLAIERPYRAFALSSPNLPEPDYAIQRHNAGGRKDLLTVAAEDGSGPRLMIEIYRPGREIDGFADPLTEANMRTIELGGPYELAAAEALDSKFGRFTLFAFTARSDGHARNCLGFVRPYGDPRLQIAGWYCKRDVEVVERRPLFCALEGLSLLAAASDPKVQQLFAAAEQRRTFCSPRVALRGTAPQRLDWIEGPALPKLRRTLAAR
jgi:hypothetical protein